MSDIEGTGTRYTSPLEGVTIESIQITLDLYRSGKAGVPIDTLWQFSCPILNHYQLELNIDPGSDVTAENIEDASLMLDILETASMIWDYCVLEPKKKLSALDTLTNDLLGHSPERTEAEQFMHLLSNMESLWLTLSKDAENTDPNWSPCEDSTWDSSTPISTNGTSHYGPDSLDIPEAFALFSRPLLDNDAVNSDPDLLEEAMTRAEIYWELAHVPSDQLDRHLNRLAEGNPLSSTPGKTLKEEALSMIEHFYQLFPERK
ncbi:MAG: hypothetical protein KTR29_00665 [Rhodothermaceae bacterium]|nr:hypothetical protein [Rhodothermaceae bacterium]